MQVSLARTIDMYNISLEVIIAEFLFIIHSVGMKNKLKSMPNISIIVVLL